MDTKRIIPAFLFLFFALSQVISQNTDTNSVCSKIRGIAHVGYYSNNLEKEKQFYGEYSGFQSLPSRTDKSGFEDMIKFRVGNIQSVELFIEKKHTDRRFYHFAVLVENSEQMRQYLASKGLRVPKEPIKNFQNYFAFDYNNMICEMVDIRKYGKSQNDSVTPGIATHIDGVGFVVPDMEKALKFYIGVLGCKEISRKKGKTTLSVKIQLQESPDYVQLVEYLNQDITPDFGFYDFYSMLIPSLKQAGLRLMNNKLKTGNTIDVQKPEIKKSGQIDFYDINGTRIILHKR